MTYETEIEASRDHNICFYVRFDGVAERFSEYHPDDCDNWNPSETFYSTLTEDSVTLGGESLDRKKGIVMPAGMGFTIADTADTRAIFRRRGGTETRLSTSISATTTTVVFASGTNTYDDGALIHVDKEAITLGTHTSGGTYTGCTRAAEGSVGEAHLADAVVSSVPRHWRGRRVRMYSVNLESGNEHLIRTAILEDYPRQEDGVRVFSAMGLMTVLNRPILTGWEEQPISDPDYPQRDSYDFHPSGHVLEGIAFKVQDGRQLQDDGFVMFTVDGKQTMVPLFDGQANLDSAGEFIVSWIKIAGNGPGADKQNAVLASSDITVRQVDRVVARLGIAALQVIQSIEGDGANGTYDVLPGRAPDFASGTDDLVRKRVGAGIPSAWVNESSFELMIGPKVHCILDEEMRVSEWLEREVLWRSSGFLHIDEDGKLAYRRYQPLTIRGSLPSLGVDEILNASVIASDSEEDIVAKVEFACNYVPGEGYTRRLPVAFDDAVQIYDVDPEASQELRSKAIWVGGVVEENQTSHPVTAAELRGAIERYRAQGLDGGLKVPLVLPWSKHVDYVPGYRFALTDALVVDEEGVQGVTDLALEVVGTRPDIGGGVWAVDCEQVPTGVRVAPSAVVDSFSDPVVTLKDTGVHGDGTLFDDNPAEDFGAVWTVRFYDASASPPFSSSTTEQVVSVSGNDITLASPAFVPAAGDLVVLEDGSETSTGVNAAGADVHDYAFGADASEEIGTSTYLREANSWR